MNGLTRVCKKSFYTRFDVDRGIFVLKFSCSEFLSILFSFI